MGQPAGASSRRAARFARAHAAWAKFLTQALRKRLDPDLFAEYVRICAARHHLAPGPVADLALRPNPWNRYTLDPRMPLYLQTLLDLRYVDLQAVLLGLFRYSTAVTLVAAQAQAQKEEGGEAEGEKTPVTRWQSSFSSEEVIFYRLTKAVAAGSAIRHGRDAMQISVMMARWMHLFAAASAALPPEHEDDVMMGGGGGGNNGGLGAAAKRTRDDLENARAAFVMLLLQIFDHQVLLRALGTPAAKGKKDLSVADWRGFRNKRPFTNFLLNLTDVRKLLSRALASFVPSILQSASQGAAQGAATIAARLEHFRTETLAAFEPVDKKKKDADVEMDEIFDEPLGLQNIVLPPMDVARSRAGLYIYLNAAVSTCSTNAVCLYMVALISC